MKELVEGEYYEKVFRGFRLYAKGKEIGGLVFPEIVRVVVEDEDQVTAFLGEVATSDPYFKTFDDPEGWEISE